MKKTIVLALGLMLMGTSAAFAHAHLLQETPAAKSTVAAPAMLLLKFSEGVALKFTGVKVTGPGSTAVATGAESLGPTDDTILMVPLNGTLAAGAYAVVWHALSTDGHKTNGTYGFTVK
jgi:methionine-rich copper-binding protein CopC